MHCIKMRQLGWKKKKKKDENQKLFLLQTCLLLGFNYPNLSSKLFFEVLPQTGKLQKKII